MCGIDDAHHYKRLIQLHTVFQQPQRSFQATELTFTTTNAAVPSLCTNINYTILIQ